jgi:hypothetical protein
MHYGCDDYESGSREREKGMLDADRYLVCRDRRKKASELNKSFRGD